VVDRVQTPNWQLAVVFNLHPFHELGCDSDWGASLIWWSGKHHLSRWQFLGVFLIVSLPYIVLENWAKRKVKLSYLRNKKRLASPQES